jgi:hypothetical protein
MKPDALTQALRPFRQRARLVLAWRYGAIGMTVGIALTFVADLGDWWGAWRVEPWMLVALIVAGFAIGIAYALLRPLPMDALAQLIDRRAELKDRVTTALFLPEPSPFSDPLRDDALQHLAHLRPAQIFRFRWTAWHGASVGLLVALLVSRYLPQLPLPFLTQFRQDRKEAQQVARNVRRVLKPVLEHAKEPEASQLEKAIAKQLQELYRRAQQGRLSKKETLIQAEKLLAQAQKLQQQSQQHLRRVSTKAITAAETLQQRLRQRALASQMKEMQALLQRMKEIERQLQSPDLSPSQRQMLEVEKRLLQQAMEAMGQLNPQQMKQLMEALTMQMAQMQQMLQSGRDAQGRPLTDAEKQLAQQQLQSLQQALRALQLSQQAQEFLRKLTSDPNFQEAMRRLAELQKQLQQLQQGQTPQLSPEELERMLRELEKALEELAKQYGDDEKIRELAKQLLEAVKKMKAGGT